MTPENAANTICALVENMHLLGWDGDERISGTARGVRWEVSYDMEAETVTVRVGGGTVELDYDSMPDIWGHSRWIAERFGRVANA